MNRRSQTVEKVCFSKKVLVLYPYKNALWALRPAKPLGVLSRHPCRNPKPLPHGEGLCMLGWLCISAIVVVCCRCVLHRLCSTTCMRPCIEPFGIHARHPCRGYITGATAPSPCRGLCPCDPIFDKQEVYRQIASDGFMNRRSFFVCYTVVSFFLT